MVCRHLHIQGSTGVSQILGSQNCALFAYEESSLVEQTYEPCSSNLGTKDNGVEGKEHTLKVLHPTLSGQMDKSQTLRPLTP